MTLTWVYSIILVVCFIAIFWPFDKDRFEMVFNNVVWILCEFISYTMCVCKYFIECLYILINLFVYYANNTIEMKIINEWANEYGNRPCHMVDELDVEDKNEFEIVEWELQGELHSP